MTLEEISEQWRLTLDLPEGFKVTRYPSTVEIDCPGGQRATIPVPYSHKPAAWWRRQARKAIRESTDKHP